MDTKALRQKILDLAIRGKLVPQDPNDEPASVLLERIRAQKQQMVKEGKLKAKDIKNDTVIFVGEDNLHYEKHADGTVKCIEDEIPFELPEGWEWARLGSIAESDLGKMLDAAKNKGLPRPYLRNINVRWGVFDLTDLLEMRIQDEEVERYSVQKGDLVVCEGGEPGRCAIWEAEKGVFFQKALHRVRPHLVSSEYVFLVIYASSLSGLTERYFTGTTIKHLTGQALKALIIPIPPIYEQGRICGAANEALGIVDDIEENKEVLVSTLSLAKSHILDLAIRGLLVPQDPKDDPASVLLDCIRVEKESLIKQGKIKRDKRESVIFRGEDNSYYEKIGGEIRCVDNEIPFDIPKSWLFVRLKHIGEIVGGGTPKTTNPAFWDGSIAWITPADLSGYEQMYISTGNRNITEEGLRGSSAQLMPAGSVLYSSRAPIGYVAIANNPIATNQGFKSVVPYWAEMSQYLYYCLKARTDDIIQRATGTTFKEISGSQMAETIIPLPPMNEQVAIVNRIIELLDIVYTIGATLK